MKHSATKGRLDSFFDLRMGKTPPRDNLSYWNDGNNSWVAISDMGKGKYISETSECITDLGVKACNMKTVPNGTVIMSFKLSIGKVAITAKPILTNEAIMAFIPKEEFSNQINTEYLYYYLLGFKWSGLGNKAVMGVTLNKASLSAKTFYFPAMEVQEQIVAELDGINAQIDRCRQLLLTLDTLATSLFYDTFGDPVTNPKGWEVKKMKELTSLITNGTTPKGGQAVYVDSGIIFFRSQNVWRNKIIMEDVAFLDEATNASMKGSMLKHNDILITKTGRINTENSSLGRSALFEGEDDTANINGHVYLVRLNKGMSPRFVLSILLTNSYRDLIRKVCVGAIDKRQLNLTHIEQFPIIKPPLELQENYVNQIEAIEAQKAKVETTIAELQTLLDSRMDFWFN